MNNICDWLMHIPGYAKSDVWPELSSTNELSAT